MSAMHANGRSRLLVVFIVLLAIALVVGAALFLAKIYNSTGEIKVDDGVMTLLMVGVGTLLVVEVLPTLQSLKFDKGGVDISFRELGEKVTNDTDALKDRIVTLEAAVAALQASPQTAAAPAAGQRAAPTAATTPAAAKQKRLEEMRRPGRFYDDPRKGRFGRKSAVGDVVLSAEFTGPRDKSWTEVELTVAAAPGKSLAGVEEVEFYLHNTFSPSKRVVPVRDGKAELTLTIWGGFTVGVWIPATETCLELDLAELENAPRVVKER